ncbi:MAG: efflux RND transporter periplasmic adaptor subunit [Rhodospirillales bacterium]
MGTLLAACGEEGGSAQKAPPPPEVTIAQPVMREITEWDDYTGRFGAIDFVEVRARVSGYLDKIHFKDGQMVKKGDLLFTIDQRPFKLALEQARADSKLAQTRLVLAEKELKRARELLSKGHVSQSVFDQRTQARNAALAEIEASKAAANTAKLNLEYSEIRAPVSGRISRNLISVGNLIAGGTENATMLTTIVSLDPIYFYFDAPEDAYLKYTRLDRSGQRPSSRDTQNPVYLSLADETGFPHKGHMNFVENRFDAETGTIRGRAVFANAELIFQAGMFARIRLLGRKIPAAALVPDEAIGTDQSRKFVYVVGDKSTVKMRLVEPGNLIDGLRVIRKGLSADDWVIVKGVQRARDGATVTPVKSAINRPGNTTAPR